jgi:ribosome-associated toxin RatA of RatAB toxin-antitoxin module
MATLSGQATIEVGAPIERCWAVVENVADAPEWQGGLERMVVLERDDSGRAVLCDATTNAKIRNVTTRTRFDYEEPRRLSWEQVGKGELRSMRGAWELEELGEGRTRVTYRLEVDPGRLGLLVRGPVEAAVRAIVVGGRPKELAARVAASGDSE